MYASAIFLPANKRLLSLFIIGKTEQSLQNHFLLNIFSKIHAQSFTV
jgi:hypothetical protein